MTVIRRKKTRMLEPWGYQDQNNYQGVGDTIENEMDQFFADVKYESSDQKIHFYNDDGEEKGSIDVTEFAQSVIDHTEYDPATKQLKIYFSNGDVQTIDMSLLVDETDFADGLSTEEDPSKSGNTIVKVKISDDSKDFLSVGPDGVSVSSGITDLEEKAFTNAELKWDADSNGFNLEYFNIKDNSKDTVKLFDTDDNGNVIFSAGQF